MTTRRTTNGIATTLAKALMEGAMQPSKQISAVIWDLGGVIIRTDDPTPRTALADRFGMSVPQLETLVRQGSITHPAGSQHPASSPQPGASTHYDQWEQVGQALGLSDDELAGFRRQFYAGETVDSELMVFIRALRAYCRIGALSNALADLRATLEHRWGIADSFDEIIISGEEGVAKPDPRIFEVALSRLKSAPEQTIFVDDNPANIASARDLGLHTVHFQETPQAVNEVLGILTGKQD